MKILRYQSETGSRYGLLRDRTVIPMIGSPFESFELCEKEAIPMDGVRLLCPVQPSKLLAIGFNYRDHAKELRREIPTEPNVFQKPLSCLLGPDEAILLPCSMTKRVEYEGELVTVIGKRARHVAPEDALRYVFGYTCGNDVSARDLQSPTNQWTICKGFDTFGPIGPWIETDVDPRDLNIETRVNGELKQHSNTRELIFSVAQIVSYLSECMTLEPGDVIFTGTPYGVGSLKEGDTVEVTIQGIGTLCNTVKKETVQA